MNKTYKITFPFTAQVKTQLVISKNRLIKPKNVKNFENAVRAVLAEAFPFHIRPMSGYLKFEMFHYTAFKRDGDGLILPAARGDLDNLMKCVCDCFEPIYKNVTKIGEDGKPEYTKTGKFASTKQIVSPGVIKNDKYILRAGLFWVPVIEKTAERIEVYLTPLSEQDLFSPPVYADVVDLSSRAS